MGSFSPSRTSIAGEQTSRFATPFPTGGGADGSDGGVTTNIRKVNGEIITTILVDIEDLLCSGTVKDIIGEDGVAAAYIGRIITAKNGIVYKIEMACIEKPAGSNTSLDIDLVSSSHSLAEDVVYDSGAGAHELSLIAAGGNWATGMRKMSAVGLNWANLPNDYLYLTNGSGDNSGGTFTAGKFLIKLYGANF
tara:strand:+ start:168 stop:746 length:579 start_codon:yes stop_codon:yes gene_type:complete